MYYWKTFLAMCFASFAITLGLLALMILGAVGITKMNIWQWLLAGVCEAIMVMSSFVCGSILLEELKERREKHGNRASNA